jgi:hypothetical protein
MSGDGEYQRAAAFSSQLRQAHQHLKDWLGEIRRELGRDHPAAPGLPTRCLAFCSALAAHHGGEDNGLFTALLDTRPDLAPVIAKLLEDHTLIASILAEATELATRSAAASGQELIQLQRELDGLAAIAESHFRYEERAISAALDAGVPDTGWSQSVFRPGGPAA